MSNETLQFRSKRPQDKLSRTDAAAREIIQAEHAAQLAKSQRLRAARLKREGSNSARSSVAKPAAPARKAKRG